METEDNTIDLLQPNPILEELINSPDSEALGKMISDVLEFLTLRAIIDGPYYLMTDDKNAVTVIAYGEDVKPLVDSLPENYTTFEEPNNPEDYITNSDPGDEQDEPATESE